jgi:hypothetical protein
LAVKGVAVERGNDLPMTLCRGALPGDGDERLIRDAVGPLRRDRDRARPDLDALDG